MTGLTINYPKDFIRDGYALFPGMVPRAMAEAARAVIDHDLKTNFDEAKRQQYESISYCPDICASQPVMDLLRASPVWALLDEALGADAITHGRAQIAIRWAHNFDHDFVGDYHIDGVPNGLNGLTGQEIDNFTALVGVLLTDTPQTFGGNLAVWPGSHEKLQNYFREQGPQAMDMGMPKITFGEASQITGKAGDVILCHYELAHTVASNTSDQDRIVAYFRIALKDVAAHRWDYMTNIWRGWKLAAPAP